MNNVKEKSSQVKRKEVLGNSIVRKCYCASTQLTRVFTKARD